MSLNKLTNVEIGKSLNLQIGCELIDCGTMDCQQINVPPGGDITAHDIVVNNCLKVETKTDICGNDYCTPDLGQPNYSLHTDGAGNTFWSPDDTGSGDITYNGAPPTVSGQLVKFSSADGSTANQSNIIDDGLVLNLSGQSIENTPDIKLLGDASEDHIEISAPNINTVTFKKKEGLVQTVFASFSNSNPSSIQTPLLSLTNDLNVFGNLISANGNLQINDYIMPTAKGADTQILKTDALGNVTWEDSPFDQTLDTTDDVEFNSIEVNTIKNTGDTLTCLTDFQVGGSGNSGLLILQGTGINPEILLKNGNLQVGEFCASDQGGFIELGRTPAKISIVTPHPPGPPRYFEFDEEVRVDKGLIIGSGVPATQYTMPSTRGADTQILKTDGAGVVTWEDSPFDQNLNIADNVEFNKVTTPTLDYIGGLDIGQNSTSMNIGKVGTQTLVRSALRVAQLAECTAGLNIGVSPGVTDYQMPLNRGGIDQMMKQIDATGTIAFVDDVRYISSIAEDITDVKGLLTISEGDFGATQNSDSANQGPNASLSSNTTFGFTFILSQEIEVLSVAINTNHIGVSGGVRTFKIYRDSDQAIVLQSTVGVGDTIESARYKRDLPAPVSLPAGNYRVGVELVNGDNRGISDQSATVNPELLPVQAATVNGFGFPSTTFSPGFMLCGYFYFREAGADARIIVENLDTEVITVGANPGVDDYILPLTRGLYGQVLRSGVDDTVSWSPNGNYSQTGAFVTVTNTIAKTSIVGTGVGSLVVPMIGVGCSYHLKLAGVLEDNGPVEELKIIVDIGGVTVYESQFYDLEDIKTEQVWETEIDIVCRTDGVAGTFYANGQFVYSKNGGSNDFRGFNTEYDSVVNTTLSNTFDVSAQWNNANIANIFTCKMFTLTKTF